MKILDQAYNALVQTWNQLNISGHFSILKENPIPDTVPEYAATPKDYDNHPISDSDRIFSIQKDSGVMRALSHALININRYHYDYREGKSALNGGTISTCGTDPVGSSECDGKTISVVCPEQASTPMVLNPCVWKLHNEEFPKLVQQAPNPDCLEMNYRFNPDEICLSACVGREFLSAWDSEDHNRMDKDYQDVRTGKVASIARELTACRDEPWEFECVPFGKGVMTEECYSLPTDIGFLHSQLSSLRDSSECRLFTYEFDPDCIQTTVCEAQRVQGA